MLLFFCIHKKGSLLHMYTAVFSVITQHCVAGLGNKWTQEYRARPFFLAPIYFLAPATQATRKVTREGKREIQFRSQSLSLSFGFLARSPWALG